MLQRPEPLRKLYCGSCWRDEYHQPIEINRTSKWLFRIVSLGIADRIWPHRCVTCGHVRSAQPFRSSPKKFKVRNN